MNQAALQGYYRLEWTNSNLYFSGVCAIIIPLIPIHIKTFYSRFDEDPCFLSEFLLTCDCRFFTGFHCSRSNSIGLMSRRRAVCACMWTRALADQVCQNIIVRNPVYEHSVVSQPSPTSQEHTITVSCTLCSLRTFFFLKKQVWMPVDVSYTVTPWFPLKSLSIFF